MNWSKSTKCTSPRVSPNTNYGLWVNMICSYRYIICKKYITLVGDVDNDGDYARTRAGNMWEISVLSAHYCCKPNIALKNKVYKRLYAII